MPRLASKLLATLIEKVAARFGIVITNKAVAQAVPVIGGIVGVTVSIMFTD